MIIDLKALETPPGSLPITSDEAQALRDRMESLTREMVVLRSTVNNMHMQLAKILSALEAAKNR
jgi:hypothetical protein